MTRILITGSNGQVGWELCRSLAAMGEVIALDRHGLDLARPQDIRPRVQEIRPDLIVNAAAYTTVDQAEAEPDLAMAINGIAPGVLAEEAQRLGALLVHYSTDYVFDGAKAAPYTEEDAPAPINVYGASKLRGEQLIQVVGGRHLILRTSWVYGARGKNFLLTLLRLAGEQDELRVVDDQIGAPTWARFIAEATARILAHPRSRDTSGVFHLTASGATSWYGFARAILDLTAGRRTREPRLVAIPGAEYPTPAARPANSRLSLSRLHSTFGIEPPPWDRLLEQCLVELPG